MAIVVIRQDGKTESWIKALRTRAPEIAIYDYEKEHPRAEISMALVWKHPERSLLPYPGLKCISSFGAGVDFIFEDPGLPENVPVTRVVDPVLASDMSEFVLAQILSNLKNLKRFALDQQERRWHPGQYRRLSDVVVGIMGVGALGSVLAGDLAKLGVKVIGWASSEKKDASFPIYSGTSQMDEFLGKSSILVCLLPLTEETRGILNLELFKRLPKGAFVINVARGGHLVDEDLLKMLKLGHLSGAALDVYHEEPLPGDHPFWEQPSIHMSPHIASVSDQDSVVPQLIDNFLRLQNGKPLLNVVSRDKGY